jgi:hypothetical protein
VTVAEQKSTVDDAGRFIVCGVAIDRPIQLRLSVRDSKLADTTFSARNDTFTSIEWRITPP